MAYTLWKIDKRNHLLLEKDVAKLTTHLKKLDEDHLRFVVMAYDYESPFKRFPEQDRIRKAKRVVWKKDEKDGFYPEHSIQPAIEEYCGFQYDARRELIEAYKKKVSLLQNELLVSDKPGMIAKIDTDISILIKRMEELQEQIDKTEGDDSTAKDRRSMMEKWQINKVEQEKHRIQLEKKKKDNELLA